MHYSDNPKIVFVAIPKTGTRSVVDYLEEHFNARKAKGTHTHSSDIPARLKNHYSFTIVRNPFDRMVSYWWSTCKRPGSPKRMGFETFLLQEGLRGGFQYPYFKLNRFDKVIRYENLERDFMKLPFFIEGTSLKWLNPTVREWKGPPRPSTLEILTPRTCEIIRKKFRKDFELLGYSMNHEENE
jgi:hypothetical protein